jgi:hypothetical protein
MATINSAVFIFSLLSTGFLSLIIKPLFNLFCFIGCFYLVVNIYFLL